MSDSSFDQALQAVLDKSLQVKQAFLPAFVLPDRVEMFPTVYVTDMLEGDIYQFSLDRSVQDCTVVWLYLDEHLEKGFYVCRCTFPTISFDIAFQLPQFFKAVKYIATVGHFFALPVEECDVSYKLGSDIFQRIIDTTKPILDIAFDEDVMQELQEHVKIWEGYHQA